MLDEQPPIVETILGDVAALVPQFASITASYRLLVGAAEELRRIESACPEITERAIIRADRAGALIDMLLEILCSKLSFSTNFLAVSSAPVDVFRLLSPGNGCEPARLTAEQIIALEALRQLLCRERSDLCFLDKTVGVCTAGATELMPSVSQQLSPDITDALNTEVVQELSGIVTRQKG